MLTVSRQVQTLAALAASAASIWATTVLGQVDVTALLLSSLAASLLSASALIGEP